METEDKNFFRNLPKCIVFCLIDLYEIMKIPKVIKYFKQFSIIKQITFFFFLILVLWSIILIKLRFNNYKEILDPPFKYKNLFYDKLIYKQLIFQKKIILNLKQINYFESLKLSSYSQELFNIYIKELNNKSFFSDNTITNSNFTDNKWNDILLLNDKVKINNESSYKYYSPNWTNKYTTYYKNISNITNITDNITEYTNLCTSTNWTDNTNLCTSTNWTDITNICNSTIWNNSRTFFTDKCSYTKITNSENSNNTRNDVNYSNCIEYTNCTNYTYCTKCTKCKDYNSNYTNFIDLFKIYYLYLPLIANLHSLHNIEIDTSYLIYYSMNKTDPDKKILSNFSVDNINVKYIQYPLSRIINQIDPLNTTSFMPYDFSIDPVPFFYNPRFDEVKQNWFHLTEYLTLEKNIEKYYSTQIIMEQSNSTFEYFRNSWMFSKIEDGERSLIMNFIIKTKLPTQKNPYNFNYNHSYETDFFSIYNQDPTYYLYTGKSEYRNTSSNYSKNYDIDTELSIINYVPLNYDTIFRYTMTNKITSLNYDNINYSLMKLNFLEDITQNFTTQSNFDQNNLFFTFLYYLNNYKIIENISKNGLINKLNSLTNLLDNNTQGIIKIFNDNSLNNNSSNNNSLNNNSSNNNSLNNISKIFCDYLNNSQNFTRYYEKLKEQNIKCFNDTNDLLSHYSETVNCYCMFLRCLNIKSKNYVKEFKKNSNKIEIDATNFFISNTCLLYFYSMKNDGKDILRFYHTNLNDNTYANNSFYVFYGFVNLTRFEGLYNQYNNSIILLIKIVGISLIFLSVLTIFIMNTIVSLSSFNLIERINLIVSLNSKKNYIIDEKQEILQSQNESYDSEFDDILSERENKIEIENVIQKKSLTIKNSNKINRKNKILKKIITFKENDNDANILIQEFNPYKHEIKGRYRSLPIKVNRKKSKFVKNLVTENFTKNENEIELFSVKNYNDLPTGKEKINDQVDLVSSNTLNLSKSKSKEDDKDELNEIDEILKKNKELFMININFQSIQTKESKKHKYFNEIFKEKIKIEEFFIKNSELIEKKYEKFFCNKFLIFEFFQLEYFDFDIENRNFLFKFEEQIIDENDTSIESKLVEKRKEFFCRINDLIINQIEEIDENSPPTTMKEHLNSVFNYYIENILIKWLWKINRKESNN